MKKTEEAEDLGSQKVRELAPVLVVLALLGAALFVGGVATASAQEEGYVPPKPPAKPVPWGTVYFGIIIVILVIGAVLYVLGVRWG